MVSILRYMASLPKNSKKDRMQLGGRPPPRDEDSTGSEDIDDISLPKKKKKKPCHWLAIIFCVFLVILLLIAVTCLILSATWPAFNARIMQTIFYIAHGRNYNMHCSSGVKPDNSTIPAIQSAEFVAQMATNTTIDITEFQEVDITNVNMTNISTTEENTALAVVRPIPFTVFPFPQDGHPKEPILTAEKVSGKYIYDFYSESVSYETSVEFCRHLSKGSRLLSIESNEERRAIDAYVQGYRREMFKRRKNRFVWTGGYFDLESEQPYELRWIDQPKSNADQETYLNFCPESNNTKEVIDSAIMNLKLRLKDMTDLNPCDRSWAHVITDYRGHRLRQSCWQIIERDIHKPDEWKLPFVCKR